MDPSSASFVPTPVAAATYLEPYVRGKRVIDLGCGDGSFAAALVPYAKSVSGVDVDKLWSGQGPLGVSCSQQDIESVNLDGYDVVFVALNFYMMESVWRIISNQQWSGTLISLYYPLPHVRPNTIIDVQLGNGDFFFDRFPFLVYELKQPHRRSAQEN